MRHRWFNVLMLFIISIGIAAGCNHLSIYQQTEEGYSEVRTPITASENASTIAFPVDYQRQFMQYVTVAGPTSGIIRKMYVNRPSLETIAATQTVPVGTVIVMETQDRVWHFGLSLNAPLACNSGRINTKHRNR